MRPSQLIEKYGWVQGIYGSLEIGFCAEGAIRAADRHPPMSFNTWLQMHNHAYDKVFWNDDPKRTKEEVISALKQWEDEYYATVGAD